MSGAVLFPGQGAQAPGMGLDLVDASPAAREVFERGEAVLDLDLRGLIAGGDRAALDRTDVCQPAILVTSLAAMAALEERGRLDRVGVAGAAGLSLGEYSALAWAGALSLEDAVRLVRLRGQAMQRASEERPSGMLSLVGADEETAAALCHAARGDGVLVVANLLAPGQVAISGTLDAIERAEGLLREHGVRKGVRLPVAGAFHSPCMASAEEDVGRALDEVALKPPSLPVHMNVSAEPAVDVAELRELLRRQLTSPVLWQATMEALLARGVRAVLEPAPGRQLTNMLRRYRGVEVRVTTCGDAAELEEAPAWPGASTTEERTA